MKKRVLVFVPALLVIVVLGWGLLTTKADRDFLQKNIDQQFCQNLSSLSTGLFSGDAEQMEDDALLEYYIALAGNSKVCMTLFPYTSYRENESLGEIVRAFAEMVPPNNIYDANKLQDRQFIDALTSLPLHPESADEVWQSLSEILPAMEK